MVRPGTPPRFFTCCHPFPAVRRHADTISPHPQLNAVDWLEAFKGHPAIGAEAGRGQHSGDLSAREQAAAAASATEETARALAVMNGRYEARFGHVFLIFASGKTSDAILDALRQRYVT